MDKINIACKVIPDNIRKELNVRGKNIWPQKISLISYACRNPETLNYWQLSLDIEGSAS
jgi:hypothetical protein